MMVNANTSLSDALQTTLQLVLNAVQGDEASTQQLTLFVADAMLGNQENIAIIQQLLQQAELGDKTAELSLQVILQLSQSLNNTLKYYTGGNIMKNKIYKYYPGGLAINTLYSDLKDYNKSLKNKYNDVYKAREEYSSNLMDNISSWLEGYGYKIKNTGKKLIDKSKKIVNGFGLDIDLAIKNSNDIGKKFDESAKAIYESGVLDSGYDRTISINPNHPLTKYYKKFGLIKDTTNVNLPNISSEKCGGRLKKKKVKKMLSGAYMPDKSSKGCSCTKLHRIGGRLVTTDCFGNIIR